MPEGDTVHKVAAFLAEALSGQPLTRLLVSGRPMTLGAGLLVGRVTSHGKHLFIELGTQPDSEPASGLDVPNAIHETPRRTIPPHPRISIRVHLGLYGAWHWYPIGQPWQKPIARASLILTVAARDFICFNAKEVAVFNGLDPRRHDRTAPLGPDLTRVSPPPGMLLERARGLLVPTTPVTDLLLDQRIACGIGNVYTSEVLFLEHCHPETRFGALSLARFSALYLTAERLLKANLGGGPRVTRRNRDGRGHLWVYGRARQPCLACGTAIQQARLGRHQRSTYWCPECQRHGTSPAGATTAGASPPTPDIT
ncbi:hypothetical protein CKO25_12175 [Thiocapsa imhoffii]|uniref:DNA-(apurinic or apyrimidinic site) lyase n=1 Tax=Thiocapsa imhoffii TaxID=382777 RepID=A0A9X0WIW9_9GAMM|nr:zinc finger domain-containing protein [Thiocapsa imhoffii]MBK1645386.1 hypothetical protein [Thiocapsa imhoffii]